MDDADHRKGIGTGCRWYLAAGEAAQAGARLESVIAHLHQDVSATRAQLAGRTRKIPWRSPSESLAQLHEMVGDLSAAGWSELQVGLAQAVLSAAGEALQMRNRIIHDPWTFDSNGDSTYATRVRLLDWPVPELEPLRPLVGVTWEPAYLEDFEQTVLDLVRVRHQVVMLGWVINGVAQELGVSTASSWAQVWGEFDIIGFDEARPHDPSR